MLYIFNNETIKKITDEIDKYLDYTGSEFMSNFYSEICDTYSEIEKDKVIVYDSRDDVICKVTSTGIDCAENEVYSFIIRYLLEKHNENIIEQLRLNGKLK